MLPSTIAPAGHSAGADRPRPCDRLISVGPRLPFATWLGAGRFIPRWATAGWPHPYHGSLAKRRANPRLASSRKTVSTAVMGSVAVPTLDGLARLTQGSARVERRSVIHEGKVRRADGLTISLPVTETNSARSSRGIEAHRNRQTALTRVWLCRSPRIAGSQECQEPGAPAVSIMTSPGSFRGSWSDSLPNFLRPLLSAYGSRTLMLRTSPSRWTTAARPRPGR